MLHRAFKKFNQEHLNNYYALDTNGATFLATESVLRYKRWFRNREFTQGLKLMPVYSFVIRLFVEVLRAECVKEADEPEYKIVDIPKLRKKLREELDATKVKGSPFDYTRTSQNPVIQAMISAGNHLLVVEAPEGYSRTIWLARQTRFGDLFIYSVLMQGRGEKESVVAINTFTYSRETIDKMIQRIAKQIEQMNEREKQEKQEKEVKE